MLSQTDAVKKAWAATDRTLDIIVTIDGKDYQATEINSLNYDAGAFTGDTLGIGSTYENSVTIEFSSVVEAFKQGLTVLPKVGILVNGKFEYTKLGTFIISEVNRDRNNNLTTIKALDQMCKLEGQYKPTVSDTASPLDIIADIANQGGVSVNTGELQHLPTLPNIKRIEGQTLRTAIGWIAQLYDGFAAFDRDGKLTIRTTATPDYTITPGEYQQGGLTKNEVAYKTGGIKVTVNTKKTDDSGQEVDDTTTLQAGETTGSQIELTNDSMTSDLLTTVWTGIKDITYYPYTLNWFGNPNLEAGDWVTLTDTQGNKFNVPVNQYTMSFNGGLESTISATQSSSTAGGYAYTGSAGSIKNMIEALQVRHTASGNNIYPPSYQGQPQNPKKGDVWYKQNGNNIEVWIYQEEDGKLSWVRTPLDGEVKAELQAMGKKTDEDLTRVKSELSSEAESQWQSAKTATSEADQRLTSLQAEQNASLADLHDTADSLHAAANSLHADADSMRASLTTATSGLGKDITATRDSLTAAENSLTAVDSSMRTATSETASELASTRNSLAAVDAGLRGDLTKAGNDLANTRNSLKTATSEVANDLTSARNSLAAVDNSLRTATSEVGNNLTNVKNSLAAVDADLRNGITKAGNDLADAKTSLAATGNSLATATSELQRKTGQLSGSLSTADSMIMYNSNAIAEVKRTAGEISTTVSNIRVGGRNLLTNTRTLTDVWNGATETVDGFTAAKMTKTAGEWQDIVAWNGLTNIKPNTDYVLTFYAKASQQTQINSYFYNIGTGDTYIDGLTPNTLTTDYQHYTVHFHTMAMPTGRTVNCLPVRVYDNVTVWVYGCQLEEGNTATQWQPNPADTNQAISKVSQTADTIRADLTNTQGDVASVKATASSLQSQITDNKNSISSVKQTADSLTSTVGQMPAKWQKAINDKASAQVLTNGVDMNNLTTAGTYLIKDFSVKNAPISAYFMATVDATADHTRVVQRVKKDDANIAYERSNNLDGSTWTTWERVATGTDISSINQTMDSITTRVSNAEGDVSGLQQTAKSLQSSISDNAKNISSVTQTANNLTTRMSNAEGNISQLQQTANGLTSTVSNMDVGGRNLLSGDTGKEYSQTGGSSWIDVANFRMLIPADQEHYVLSFDAKATKAGQQISTFFYCQDDGSKNCTTSAITSSGFNGTTDGDGRLVTTLTTEYKRYWIKYTINPANKVYLNAIVARIEANSGTATVSVKNAKLETGTMPTDWTPSPESIDSSISQIQQTADRIQAQVNDNKGNISSVTQTANAVKTDLENTKGDVASVKAKADSLTTQMADANGNISQLQQTAKGLQSTVAGQDGKISQLQHDADGLNFTVKNMKSGGANMLPAGKLQSYYDSTVTYDAGSDTYTIVNPASANAQWGSGVALSNAVIEVPWGQTACISMQVYSPTAGTLAVDINNGGDGVTGGNDNDNRDKSTSHNMDVPANTWTTVWFTYENSSTSRNPNKASLWDQQTGIGLMLNGVTWKVRHPMVQIGTFPSEWSPSPKDTDSAISQLKITADGLTTKVADTESNVSSLQLTAKGLQTQVTNNKNDVASLQVTAGGIRTDLTNAKNDIASVRAKADSLTTSMANANDQISTLQHRADSITSTLSNGGVNLLNKSNEFGWGIAGWNGNPSHSIIDDDNGLKDYKISLVAGAGNDGFWWGGNNTLNQTYTLSFDAKSDNGAAKLANVGLEGNFLMSNPPTISKEWMRYSVSGKVTEANHNWTIYFAASTADNVYVRRVQLEYGDNATPWKPSNGDISSLQQTAQGLTADMKDAKGNISNLQVSAGQLTTDMKNANGNISSIQETADRLSGVVGDANSGLVSSVNAMPGKITSAITASQQAKVIAAATDVHNMTTAGYYLLKGTLTNSPVDAWAFLRVITSDSGDRIYHRIWKDDGSTVYTEEWTGSWSSWATHINSDNLKSNVITAINQSTEGVSITGAKITLDGNVNVAPGFTLSADRITAGTLSADRISGGTLNFSNITVNGLTANSISSGSISGQNLNINLDNGTVEFTKGNLHSTDGGFNISIDNKSFYLDTGSGSKLWIDNNGFHLQESATQHLWMNKDGLHNYTDANGNGLWINDTELRVLNSSNAGLVAKDGILQFSANPIWNSDNVYSGTLNDQIYGTIGFNSNLLSSSLNGIFIKGREGVVIGTSSYGGGSLFGADGFLDVGQAGSGINLPDDLNKPASIFTKSALTLLGGPTYPASFGMSDKARVCIGCDTYYTHSGASMSSGGNDTRGNNISINARNTNIIGYDWVNIHCRNGRIAFEAQWVHSYPTYRQTTSAGANVYIAEDGALMRSSSARKYKTDIQDANNDYGNKLIEFAPQKWIDRSEKKRYEEDPENNEKPGYYYGLIADDLAAAGLDMLVNYGADGEVEGINYDRLAVALLPVIKSLKDQVASLKKQIKALTK